MRREIPLILTFLFGAFYVLSNFIVSGAWEPVAETVNNWVLVVIAFTYALGVGNLLRIHGVKISRGESGWGYSLTTLVGLLVMLVFGFLLWLLPQTEGSAVLRFRAVGAGNAREAVRISAPSGSGDLFDVRISTSLSTDVNQDKAMNEGDELECRIEYAYSGSQPWPSAQFGVGFDSALLTLLEPVPGGIAMGPSGAVWNAETIEPSWFGRLRAGNGQTSMYTWFYDSVYVPMQSTMFALLAFFISSAAFRAFRIRSTHAVLLGVAALIVILGSVPVGEAVWGRFPDLVAWVMNCLQTAGKRAILIGAALGAIATGMKMIVGAERGYLSRD